MAASGTNLAAIYNDGVSPQLTQITLITKNSTKAAGLYTDHGATSLLDGVTIKVQSTESVGAYLIGDNTIRDSVIEATNDESTGIDLQQGSVEVHGSTVEGSAGRAILNFGNVRVGASQVIGGVTTAQGIIGSAKCVASYNANFDPLSDSCR
jgi:hypothetical protein